MFLSRIRIANFKSLKDVEINSEGLVALVGPNGAGKTNFALAMKFLAEVHQHGLEMAISRAGGIENIAYRKGRRTTAPIEFEVELKVDAEWVWRTCGGVFLDERVAPSVGHFLICHRFSCKAARGGIGDDFVVVDEVFCLKASLTQGDLSYTITRSQEGTIAEEPDGGLKERWANGQRLVPLPRLPASQSRISSQALFATSALLRENFRFVLFLSYFFRLSGVFHFSSDKLRESGVPTPNPALAMSGDNLPTMIDWLQKKYPKVWMGILDAMLNVVPELRDITVYPLASKTYGLLFQEEGVKQPWRIDEVSDGTIHALSMLVAAADPRTSALVIEEPESSLHPWIIYELTKKLRELSKDKSIFLTTHSPVLIDTLKPSEVWIVSRRKGKTEIRRLTELDTRVEKDWSEGKYGLSEYLDSGLIPRAVPGGRM